MDDPILTLTDHPEGKPGCLITGKYRILVALIQRHDGTLEAASFHQTGEPATTDEEYKALAGACDKWATERN